MAPYATYGTEELARYTAEALGEFRQACLLQNHGAIAVGENAGETFSRAAILEEMAEIYYRTRMTGEPILPNQRQVTEVAAKIADYGQFKSASETRSRSTES